MKIGIIGYGFVGKAVSYGFSHPDVVQTIVDPKLNKPIENAKDVDFALLRYLHLLVIMVKSTQVL